MDESRWDGLGRGRFWSNTCCLRWYFLLCLSFVILIPYCLSALVDHWINAQFPFHFSPSPIVVEIFWTLNETSAILFFQIWPNFHLRQVFCQSANLYGGVRDSAFASIVTPLQHLAKCFLLRPKPPPPRTKHLQVTDSLHSKRHRSTRPPSAPSRRSKFAKARPSPPTRSINSRTANSWWIVTKIERQPPQGVN